MDIKVLSYVIIPYILFGLILIIAIAIMWRKKLKLLPLSDNLKTSLANLQERNRLSERYTKIFGIWLLGALLLFFNSCISWSAKQGVPIINLNSVTIIVFLIITALGIIKK